MLQNLPRRTSQRMPKMFNLLNYPIHLDQAIELGLDVTLYAKLMAEALAHVLWKAQVNAKDVEFVLAPPRESDIQARTAIRSEFLGDHALWLLDYDCCRDLPQNEQGVEQAVAAFYGNDPFYPRPYQDEEFGRRSRRLF